MILKKGAMFGLDARIALAIFGALSVISGAALYSAIQDAKNEKYRQDYVEFIKAVEAYYLDNGEMLPMVTSTSVNLFPLVENTLSAPTWSGPYLPYEKFGASYLKIGINKDIDGAFTGINLLPASEWADNSASCIVNSTDCLEWINTYSGNATSAANLEALFYRLDEHIDNGDGAFKGRVRMQQPIANSTKLLYRGINRKRLS